LELVVLVITGGIESPCFLTSLISFDEDYSLYSVFN